MSFALPHRAWLPDEVTAAAETLRRSFAVGAPTASMRARYLAFYSSIYAVGSLIGLASLKFELITMQSVNFWRSALTLLAVLMGFMITTMLFTGKVEVAKSLTLEQLEKFSKKSNHLLMSQFGTLLSHVAAIFLIGAITAVDSRQLPYVSVLIPLVFGFLAISFFRSLLVPIQIIELHRFVHAALLKDKRKEIDDALGGI